MSQRLKNLTLKFIISISIFVFTVFFTPNFNISNLYILFISAFFIIVLDYLIEVITGIYDYPIGRGIVGFFSAIVIIYATQFFISGYYISIFSSIIAAAIYSFFDYIISNTKT